MNYALLRCCGVGHKAIPSLALISLVVDCQSAINVLISKGNSGASNGILWQAKDLFIYTVQMCQNHLRVCLPTRHSQQT